MNMLLIAVALCLVGGTLAQTEHQGLNQQTQPTQIELGNELTHAASEDLLQFRKELQASERRHAEERTLLEQKLRQEFEERLKEVINQQTKHTKSEAVPDPEAKYELEGRVSDVEENLRVMDHQVIALQLQVVSLQNLVITMETEINTAHSKLDDQEDRIENLEDHKDGSTDESVSKRLTVVENELEEQSEADLKLNLQLNELLGRTASLERQTNALKGTDAGLTDSLGSLKDRVNEIEANPTDGSRYSFFASLQSNDTESNDVIVFDRVDHNRGSVYDAATGVWTAPVDGVFHFTVHLSVYQVLSSAFAWLIVDGEETVFIRDYRPSTLWFPLEMSVQLQLVEGQTVTVQASAVEHVEGYVQHSSWFGGHLVEK